VHRSRPREYLTEREIEKLMDAAGGNHWGHRDATAILIAYCHGQRAFRLALGQSDSTAAEERDELAVSPLMEMRRCPLARVAA
jgi:hypothetical protein